MTGRWRESVMAMAAMTVLACGQSAVEVASEPLEGAEEVEGTAASGIGGTLQTRRRVLAGTL